MKQYSPKQRVMTVLRGEIPDRTPFTIYETKVPRCTWERDLRNRGLCLVRRVTTYDIKYPDVKVNTYSYKDDLGRNVIRTVYSTPFGEVYNVVEPAGFTSWVHEKEFKSPDDYRKLLFLIENAVVVPNYDAIANMSAEAGDDFIIRDSLGMEPMNSLILGFMGVEQFSMEWMDNRDEVLMLYDAFVGLARKIYSVVAAGPLETANYGGNTIPSVVGGDNFRKYYIPHYNEAAEILHAKGKLLGSHFDDDNTIIMEAIGETDLDYIEAYDPGMSPSVTEARSKWPDKSLWINWPSAWHLEPPEQVYENTLKLIGEAKPGNRFIIGITEDVPEDRWQINYKAIQDAIDDKADGSRKAGSPMNR